MTLKEFLLEQEDGSEVEVYDIDYDTFFYCYNDPVDVEDLWSIAINKLENILTVVGTENGCVVNLSEVVENSLDKIRNARLFKKNVGGDEMSNIMFSMHSILSGNVSEKWLESFVNCLI